MHSTLYTDSDEPPPLTSDEATIPAPSPPSAASFPHPDDAILVEIADQTLRGYRTNPKPLEPRSDKKTSLLALLENAAAWKLDHKLLKDARREMREFKCMTDPEYGPALPLRPDESLLAKEVPLVCTQRLVQVKIMLKLKEPDWPVLRLMLGDKKAQTRARFAKALKITRLKRAEQDRLIEKAKNRVYQALSQFRRSYPSYAEFLRL